MAVDRLYHIPDSGVVAISIPNERETQILGGTQTHSSVGIQAFFALSLRAERLRLPWLVRFETQLIYPRVSGRPGEFYPDCLVAFDVQLSDLEPYDIRRVGKPPVLVIEVVSRKTARKDREAKPPAYAQMGVQELVTFDPRPRKRLELKGYRLAGPGRYDPIKPAPEGGLWLATVDLRVVAEPRASLVRGPRLRFYERDGSPLLHTEEEQHARLEAERELDRLRQLVAEQFPPGGIDEPPRS